MPQITLHFGHCKKILSENGKYVKWQKDSNQSKCNASHAKSAQFVSFLKY